MRSSDGAGELAEPGDRTLQRRAGRHQQIRGGRGQIAERGDRAADGVAFGGQSADQRLGIDDQLIELTFALVDRIEYGRQVPHQITDDRILVGDLVRQVRGGRHQIVDGALLTLEDLDDLVGQLVHVIGGQRLEQRPETVEQGGQVQRGPGVLDARWSRLY